MKNLIETIKNIWRIEELRTRILITLGLLLVYRIGSFIVLPGVDSARLAATGPGGGGGIVEILSIFTGGAFTRASIFALGIMPYISASIIMQLMTAVSPQLEALRKEGQAGQRKITQYTRYGTLALAIFQAMGIALALEGQAGLVIDPGMGFRLTAVVSLVAGTMFLMWLGEQITERGIGNGITMIILGSIVAGLPTAIGSTLELVNTGEISAILALMLVLLVFGITTAVCFLERGQRRLPVHYAKRQQGRRLYAGQSTHLPFKINMSGVIPPIFASSLILFPATIASWFGTNESFGWLQTLAAELSPGQLLYDLLYAVLILFFCFFYTALVFDARETADNLKRSGAFLPGIRPGQQTAEYIDRVLTRLTFWGGLYIMLICLLPQLMITYWKVPFYFGGTSLLIIVVGSMDFMAQLQAHMMSHQYKGLLEKANLRGYGRAGQIR